MNQKLYISTFLLFLLFFAAAIRIHSAALIPYAGEDEIKKINFSRNHISFKRGEINFPVGSEEIGNPLVTVYLLKAGMGIFGQSKLGSRIIFIMAGILSIFIMFFLIKENLGFTEAVLGTVFIAVSQLHIGLTRIISENGLLMLFVTLFTYTFIKAFRAKSEQYFYITAVLFGVSCLVYESVYVYFIIFPVYMFMSRSSRYWFGRREFYMSILIVILINVPYLIWSYHHDFYKFNYEQINELGISLRTVYLYFGEIIANIILYSEFFTWNMQEEAVYLNIFGSTPKFLSTISIEYPIFHWPYALIVLSSFVYYAKKVKDNELIRFSFISLCVIFVITSIIAGPKQTALFDNHWWAAISIIPGTILASGMLEKCCVRWAYAKYVVSIGVFYFCLHALYIIQIPTTQFSYLQY